LSVFVLLIGVWYCYKRGKEERLKAEKENETKSADASPKLETDVVSNVNDTMESALVPIDDTLATTLVDDTPIQIESDSVPSNVWIRARKNIFKGRAKVRV
jgi:hypothetical protein